MLEYAAFQNLGLRPLFLFASAIQQRPFGAAAEESLHSRRGAPIQIASGIQSVAQPGRYRNDPLVLIVRQSHENVDRALRRSPCLGEDGYEQTETEEGCARKIL